MMSYNKFNKQTLYIAVRYITHHKGTKFAKGGWKLMSENII